MIRMSCMNPHTCLQLPVNVHMADVVYNAASAKAACGEAIVGATLRRSGSVSAKWALLACASHVVSPHMVWR